MRVSMDCMPSWAKNVPLRAPASPAPFSDCSPRTAGPQPHDVLRLALRRGEASEGGRSPPPSYLDLEEAPHLHGEAHVAFELELARHEGRLAVELATDHVQPVLRGHGDGQVGRGRGARVHRAGAVLDHGMPGAATVAADLVLDGLV